MENGRRRVVITGMGGMTCIGETVAEYWRHCLEGRSGIGRMTLTDPSAYGCQVSGEVRGFDPERYMERRDARRMARFSQLAVAAAGEAIKDAELRLDREDPYAIGVLLGNGNGGFPELDAAVRSLALRGPGKIDPLLMAKILPNMAAGQVSLQFGIKGYNSTVTTACAASTQALGEAVEVIRRGHASVMLSGGAEAGISELGLAGFDVLRALTTKSNDEPERASRPFDAGRDGFVPSEGSGVFVLEALEHAQSRGARILCEIAGYGATADAYHVVAPSPDGEGAARAIQMALEDARLTPTELDYINAHGTSTPLNDAAETVAIKRVFGEAAYGIPVSSTKSMVGHALGGAGAVELIACVKAIEEGMLPPTINQETPDPECDLDYVPNVARPAEVRTVLKNSFGFGGQNACLVLRRFEG